MLEKTPVGHPSHHPIVGPLLWVIPMVLLASLGLLDAFYWSNWLNCYTVCF